MSQTALITLLSILLYTGGILGGGQPHDSGSSSSVTVAVEQQHGVVRANTVSVHDEPRSRSIIANLVRGDDVTVLEKTGGWYKVRVANGQIGYVNTFAVALSSTSTPSGKPAEHDVVAYYVTDDRRPSMPSLQENLDLITTVIPWMWQINPEGSLTTDFDAADVGRALSLAGEKGTQGLALVHNLRETNSGAITFDSSLIHEMISDPRARHATIENLFQQLKMWGMSGIHIDFEMVLPKDRQNLNLFMKELYERFHPAGLEVTIAVPAKTQEIYLSSWSGGFDYGTIGRYVDKMMLMTYDEHWRGGEPGPVASIGWVERVVRYAISDGVAPQKIVLGVPAYGYDWPSHGPGRAVTYREAMENASRHGAKIQWDKTAKVPFFRYGAGRQVWFENRDSISHKLGLVKQYGLSGISLWRLGQEDPGIWSVIRQKLS